MPVFLLKIKGDYDGVDSVVPLPNNAWMLDVQASDSDEVRTEVVVCEDEEVELTSGRGTANFKCKFPGSSKEASCSITTHADVRAINGEEDGDFVAVVAFECRGLEPVKFYPREDFAVQSPGGKVFTEVDLSDGDWADYDDEADISVSITEFEYTIEKA
mmetsp:Transcript_43596/g.136794  ORF Transcript_43596/g.136794 Transcript_43596/m.136794 type:complete len:159 (-) Transcript_43596:696-1172(-)